MGICGVCGGLWVLLTPFILTQNFLTYQADLRRRNEEDRRQTKQYRQEQEELKQRKQELEVQLNIYETDLYSLKSQYFFTFLIWHSLSSTYF